MTKRALVGTVAASGLFIWAASTGLQGAKPSSDVPVVADLAYDSANGINGDNAGVYTNGANNVASLILVGTGNFIFDTNDRASTDGHRRLAIDFHNQPLAPGPAGPHYVDVFLGTLGLTGTSSDGSLATMAAGADLQRRTRIGWVENGHEYSLRFDNQPGDGVLNFHCDVGTPCTNWTVTPTGLAALYEMGPSLKGKPPGETLIGRYTMPFSMTLAR